MASIVEQAVAKRYARALWEALEKDVPLASNAYEFLNNLGQASLQNKELELALESPAFDLEQKSSLLKALAEKLNGSKPLVRFVQVLAAAGRATLLPSVAEQFKLYLYHATGAADALVESAHELSSGEEEKIKTFIKNRFLLRATLNKKTNADLVAGVRIKVAGHTIDSSFLDSVEKLKQSLLKEI